MNWPPSPAGSRLLMLFQQIIAIHEQKRPITKAVAKKVQGAGPQTDTVVSIKPMGQATIPKSTITRGNTVTPCSAVHAPVESRVCFKSHSAFMMENQVQEMTAAIPKPTPTQYSVPPWALAVTARSNSE